MACSARTCSYSALLVLFATSRLPAQVIGTAFEECDAATVAAMTPVQLGAWASFAPETLKTRFAPARARGAWSAIVDTLRMLYGVDAPAAGMPHSPASLAALGDAGRAILSAQLDSVQEELRAGQRDPMVRLNGAMTTKRFDVAKRVIAPQGVSLFAGRAPGPIALHTLSAPERRTMCWLSLAVQDLTTLYGGPARAALAHALVQRAARWDNFMLRGYSMTPLELFANGYMPRDELEPPRIQLVLGHVSPGQQMFSEGPVRLENLRRRTVLVLEPIGALRYSDQFDSYWGGTVVLAYPDSGGLSPGVMLHHSKVGHVAGLWRPDGPGTPGGAAVLLSLDLYRYLSGAKDLVEKIKVEPLGRCLADVPSCLRTVGVSK